MKEFLESLSLGTGAIMIAICSAVLVWPLSRVRPTALRWLGGAGIPFALACALYWSPVWLDSKGASEYSTWQYLVVGVWFLAGAVASAVVLVIFGQREEDGAS